MTNFEYVNHISSCIISLGFVNNSFDFANFKANEKIEYNNTHDEYKEYINEIVNDVVDIGGVGKGERRCIVPIQFAYHHINSLYSLADRVIQIGLAERCTNLKRTQEAEIDHEKEREEFKAVLNRLAKRHRIRAELENSNTLEIEGERHPSEKAR